MSDVPLPLLKELSDRITYSLTTIDKNRQAFLEGSKFLLITTTALRKFQEDAELLFSTNNNHNNYWTPNEVIFFINKLMNERFGVLPKEEGVEN
jgi:hypothetical protein